RPVQHSIGRQDGAELGGEGVERSLEIIGDDNQRHGKMSTPPGRHPPRACLEGAEGQLTHDDQRVCPGARRNRADRLATVEDDRGQSQREDGPEVGDERLERSAHLFILRAPRNPASRVESRAMRFRDLNVGCFGGGTGLPSLLGGLKRNPWLRVHAVVTMFDSGGSSGQLRDELGVLPPGDVLECALALARNESEARRVLLSRLPTLEHRKLAGHTGGNLLLSMMERYSGDFLAAVDGLRTLLGCSGKVWPITTQLTRPRARNVER